MPYFIDKNCTRCGACLPECPTNAIVDAEPTFLIHADVCSDCVSCVPICPVHAIQRISDFEK